jgi:hypothetical protein
MYNLDLNITKSNVEERNYISRQNNLKILGALKMKHNSYQKIAIILITLMFTFTFNSCIHTTDNNDNNYRNKDHFASADFSYSINTDGLNQLELYAISGSVEITGSPNLDSVKIYGERRVESDSDADAQSHLAYLNVSITTVGNRLTVTTEQPDEPEGRNYLVFYHINIPDTWQTMIENINGNINISLLRNQAIINNINGEISLSNFIGDLICVLTNGNINLGSIHGNINAMVVNGTISGNVTIPQAGSCLLNTTNGQISLSIPQNTSALFNASVVNGNISLSDLILQEINSSPQQISGILGNGEGDIRLRTVNGNILVTGF